MKHVPPGGSARHPTFRTVARVVGPLFLVMAAVLIGLVLVDFFRGMGSDAFDAEPTRFWMFFAALPLVLVGGGLTQAGYTRATGGAPGA